MRANTQAVSIETAPRRVVEFLKDPQNLPKWAVGFAKAVRRDDNRWVVSTASGEMGIRIEADRDSGVVDFWMSPSPGIEALAASRVVPRGEKTEYVFTQFQDPGMTDEAFAMSIKAVAHELTVLKALLEVECPL
jgi:hypothetical protein